LRKHRNTDMLERKIAQAPNRMKATFALLASLALALSCAAPALAAEGSYEVRIDSSAEGLVSVDKDFFAHFGAVMPGDTLEGSVDIRNDGNVERKFYFYTEPHDGSNRAEGEELLDLVTLTIAKGDGSELYEGPLRAGSLNDPVYLGAYKGGEGETISFSLHIPGELGNEFAMAKTEVVWVFGAEDVPNKAGGSYSKTGEDLLKLAAMAGLGAVAVACTCCLVYRNVRKRKSNVD